MFFFLWKTTLDLTPYLIFWWVILPDILYVHAMLELKRLTGPAPPFPPNLRQKLMIKKNSLFDTPLSIIMYEVVMAWWAGRAGTIRYAWAKKIIIGQEIFAEIKLNPNHDQSSVTNFLPSKVNYVIFGTTND